MPPTFNYPILVDPAPGVLSDFILRTFDRLPHADYLLLNLHPNDLAPLIEALSSGTAPGVGRPVNYFVRPAGDLEIALSMSKPSLPEVRHRWVPDAVPLRFRHRASGHPFARPMPAHPFSL